MSLYNHLTINEREKILFFYAKGYSISKIAKEINRNKSTISRELCRNKINNEYSPSNAQNLYINRRQKCKPKEKLSNPSIFEYVKTKFLEEQWSPEQIAGRLKLEKTNLSISYSTIYRGIYKGLFDTKAEKKSRGNKGAIRKLRHRGKTRHTKAHLEKRGKIQISNKISDRPEAAENRERLGDWKIDTVCGKSGKACLVTLVDRKSRFTVIRKVNRKNSHFVTAALIETLKDLPLKTITPDRGKEFSKHSEVTKELGVEFYFPLPHHPWQRGTNENTNGLIREYFPKGFDITNVPHELVQLVEYKLNTRPRKCLGFKTPFEIFYDKLLHLA